MQCLWVGARNESPGGPVPDYQKEKEHELVREVKRYRLDIVGLKSTHSLDSGTSLLEGGWTLSQSGVALGERRQVGVGILVSPRIAACMLGFLPVDKRVFFAAPSGRKYWKGGNYFTEF